MVNLDLNHAGLLSAFVTAMVLLAFSLVVGALARFQGPAKWYAVFGVGFSLSAGLAHIAAAFLDVSLDEVIQVPASDGPDAATYWLSFAFNIASGVATAGWTWGIIRLLDCYGGRPYRWMGWTAAALAVAANLPSLFGAQRFESDALYNAALQGSELATLIPIGWMGAAAFILARARWQEWRSGQAILASALSAYPIAWPAWGAFSILPFSFSAALGAMFVALGSFLAVQVGWLGLRARGGGREAIAVTVVADLFLLLAIVMALFVRNQSPSTVARIYDVVLVAYAILRLQYLDLDVKVRWGISKGTVAGIVVAVVFIVSEGAQSLFGEEERWLGLALGGLVVFAIAPIQRAADRLAEKAVPLGSVPAGEPTARALYRKQAALVWADGKITAKEIRLLKQLRDELRLPAQEAERIDDEVARR